MTQNTTPENLTSGTTTPKKIKKTTTKWIKVPYDLELVQWNDAAGLRHGWLDRSDPLVPQLALSCGFVIKETADHLMIASDVDDNGAHNGRTQIPKGMVMSRKILRKKESA